MLMEGQDQEGAFKCVFMLECVPVEAAEGVVVMMMCECVVVMMCECVVVVVWECVVVVVCGVMVVMCEYVQIVKCESVLVILVGTVGGPVEAASPQLWQSYDCTFLSPSYISKATETECMDQPCTVLVFCIS